jgi:hypothetical protein
MLDPRPEAADEGTELRELHEDGVVDAHWMLHQCLPPACRDRELVRTGRHQKQGLEKIGLRRLQTPRISPSRTGGRSCAASSSCRNATRQSGTLTCPRAAVLSTTSIRSG